MRCLRGWGRRPFGATLLALTLAGWPAPAPGGRTLLGAPPAAAGDEWCENDPLVTVVTPRGNRLDVHVTNYGLGKEYLPQVQQASIKYSVGSAPNNWTGTLVTFDVLIPKGKDRRGNDVEFPTRSVISSGEFAQGTVYARGEARAGNVIKMEFYTPIR